MSNAGSHGENEGFGNVLVEDAVEATTPGRGGFLGGLFNRTDSQNARKTVTFGDAASVRSLPLYSLIALVALLLFWFLATQPWGFPDEYKSVVDEQFAVAADDAEIRNQERIDGGQSEIAIPTRSPRQQDYITSCTQASDDVCDTDDFFQLVSPNKFPSPGDTVTAFRELSSDGFQNVTLWTHARISLWRVARGMLFGTLLGVPIGMAMGLNSKLRGVFDTPVELFRPIPPLALLPLFIAFFGIGDKAAVPLLIFASVWIMIIAARAGTRSVKLSKVRAAYSLGASKSQVLRRVILPNALPELFTGVRVALGVSWGTLVAAELVGTTEGLGSMIFLARNFLRLDVVVVGIIVIAVIGVLMDLVMRFAESKLIPWRGKG